MAAVHSAQYGGWFARLRQAWREWCRRWGALADLDRITAELARDVGLSVSDMRIIAAKRPDATELLRPRLAVLGIDYRRLGQTNPEILRDLARVRILCGEKRRCRRDLALPGSGGRAYCGNVATFDALMQQRATPGDRDERWL
jgi:uncharacterized protein YjiS (DUF1127 family)